MILHEVPSHFNTLQAYVIVIKLILKISPFQRLKSAPAPKESQIYNGPVET